MKKPGKTAKFEVKFQSDFAGGDVGVGGPSGDDDFSVQYLIDGVDRTADVIAGVTFDDLALNGHTPKILVKVKC